MKYQIISIAPEDSFCNPSFSHLIGKIGVGDPEKIPGTSNSYSGGLLLSFNTNITVHDSSKATARISKKIIKTVLADQYLYFSDVTLKKVAN